MAPCKYGCGCPKCKGGSDQMFSSPLYFGSKLGKYTGTVNKKTAIERQGYAVTTRFANAIKDKQGLIDYITRRELLRGPSGYYTAQIEQLKKEIEEIKAQQKMAMDRNDHVTQLITNNAGRMVPASVFNIEAGTQTPNTPVKPEATQTEEQGIEGEAPQPTAAPEATPTPAAPEAPETEEAPEGSEAPETEGSEAPETDGSETEEDPEIRDKRLGVYAILLNERRPGQAKREILKQVMEYDEQELDELINQYYPDQVEDLKAVIPESALQRFEMAFTGQR